MFFAQGNQYVFSFFITCDFAFLSDECLVLTKLYSKRVGYNLWAWFRAKRINADFSIAIITNLIDICNLMALGSSVGLFDYIPLSPKF